MRVQGDADRGAIAVLVAILIVAILGITAFTADFGFAFAQRQALSTGADSAALAVIQQQHAYVVAHPTDTCGQIVSRSEVRAQAADTAVQAVNANAPFGRAIPASEVTADLACVGPRADTLLATVTARTSSPAFLGGLLGVDALATTRSAATGLGAAGSVAGWVPFAVCSGQADEIMRLAALADHPEDLHVLIEKSKVWDGVADCGDPTNSGSGNWGWLTCPSNNQLSGANGTILQGCDDLLNLVPTPSVDGKTGDKGGSVDSEMQQRIESGAAVAMPVYDTIAGGGSGTTFAVVGFLTVKLCGYASKAFDPRTGACYVTTDPVTGSNVTLVDDSLQVQYADYTPSGEFSTTCGIGAPACAFNSYVTRLVR